LTVAFKLVMLAEGRGEPMKTAALKTAALKTAALLASVSLMSGACTENQLNNIPGSEAKPDILVTPERIDFGAVGSTATVEELFTIENVGTAGLSISDVLLSGSEAFTLTVPTGISTLAPGDSADVVVSYAARTAADEAVATVLSDDPQTPEADVVLVGEVLYADLEIQPDPFDFGILEPGSSTTGEVLLVNVGGETLTIDTIAVIGEAFEALTLPSLPLTLEPEESVPVEMGFAPEFHGEYEGQIWANHDGPTGTDMGTLVGGTTQTTVTGRICDPSGTGWVVGAHVWSAADEDGDGEADWYVETWTDADGYFALEGVRAGTRTIYVDKGSFSTEFEVTVTGGTYELPEDECLSGDLPVAVVTGDYDDIGHILRDLGIDYDAYSSGTYLNLLRDPEAMAEYDIIFFNCGMSFSWLSYEAEVADNLQAFVADGGSVYASDWAHAIVEASWPAQIDWLGEDEVWDPNTDIDYGHLYPYAGLAARIDGDVNDSVMASAIGSETAELVFDLDAWVVPLTPGLGTSVLISGEVGTYDEDTFGVGETLGNVPLALRFEPGGTVIYTTFHNEAQLTQDMEAALKEIILSL